MRECYRKFMWAERLGLKPKGYQSALAIGEVVHAVIAGVLRGATLEQSICASVSLITDIEKTLIDAAGASGILPSGRPVVAVLDSMYRDFQKAKAIAAWMWKRHPLSPAVWEALCVEKLLEMNYTTLKRPIRVRIDALMRMKDTDDVYILDHKTTSLSPIGRASIVQIEIQPRIYRIVAQSYIEQYNKEHHTNYKVVGFIHQIIQKPTIQFSPQTLDALTKPGAYPDAIRNKLDKGTSLTEKQAEQKAQIDAEAQQDLKHETEYDKYLDRVVRWYDERTSDQPHDPPFVRSTIRFSGPLMSQETLMALREVDRASNARVDPSRFFRDPSGNSCYKYNSMCPYMDLCTASPEQWPAIVKLRYDVSPRDQADEEL